MSRLSGTQQGGRQFICLVVTLAIALFGGLVTGIIIRLPIWEQPDEEQIFDDEDYWILQGKITGVVILLRLDPFKTAIV